MQSVFNTMKNSFWEQKCFNLYRTPQHSVSFHVCQNVKVKVSLSTPSRHIGVEVYLHSFLTSTPHGDEWLTSHSFHLSLRKETPPPAPIWIGGMVGLRIFLELNVFFCFKIFHTAPRSRRPSFCALVLM